MDGHKFKGKREGEKCCHKWIRPNSTDGRKRNMTYFYGTEGVYKHRALIYTSQLKILANRDLLFTPNTNDQLFMYSKIMECVVRYSLLRPCPGLINFPSLSFIS